MSKLLSMLLFVFLVSATNVQSQVVIPAPSPAEAEIFEVVSRYGYTLLGILTSEDDVCIEDGVSHLVIQTNVPDMDKFILGDSASNIESELKQLGATSEKYVIYYAGPGGDWEAATQRRQERNSVLESRDNCPKLLEHSVPHTAIGYTFSSNAGIVPPYNAGQSADMNGPYERPTFSHENVFMLNNTLTNNNYWFQNGLLFWQGWGSTVWTDTARDLIAQFYPTVLYDGDHTFHFLIFYTNNYWWPCVLDYNNFTIWDCVQIPAAQAYYSTTIVVHPGQTNVFFENQFTISNWYTYVGYEWHVRNAINYASDYYTWTWWQSEWKWTQHSCGPVGTFPSEDAMIGSLVGGGDLYFVATKVPYKCIIP